MSFAEAVFTISDGRRQVSCWMQFHKWLGVKVIGVSGLEFKIASASNRKVCN